MAESVSFGAYLKQRRKALDLTQAELARQLGCATVTLQKIELDERRPSKAMAERLAAVLAIAPAERAPFVRSARGDRTIDHLGETAALPAVPSPPWALAPRPRHHLPAATTSLVGRAQDVQAVCALLERADVRLLTLTGPGGSGKTRLALAAAAQLLAAFPDGVTFVRLETIRDPSRVLATIVQTLGVLERHDQPLLDTLQTALQSQQCLLVLDNFEQLLAAATDVAALLQAAPGLKVLVTSRTPLHLTGEHEVPVLPLAVPPPTECPAPQALTPYAAVALFLQRAHAVNPAFALTPATAPAVAEICRRLDGLPLAIELAAARSKFFSPQALRDRLGPGAPDRLQVLSGGARDLPQRQQTIRSTIDWSYHLLAETEQQLFWRLGVFVGGWTAEAAQAVCRAGSALGGDGGVDVLTGLEALAEWQLIRMEGGAEGSVRFRRLETIRAYAQERLAASAEAPRLRQRHAAYYLALAEAAEGGLRGPEQGSWLLRLDAEHENLRAVLAWSLTPEAAAAEGAALSLRLVGALWPFWFIRGYWAEWERWLAQARAHAGGAHPQALAKALFGWAFHAVSSFDSATARAYGAESLALYQEAEDPWGSAAALSALGFGSALEGEARQGNAWLADGLARARAVGDRWLVAWALLTQGDVAVRYGAYAQAQASNAESLALARAVGDQRLVAGALCGLGLVQHVLGDNRQALTHLEEALAIQQALGEQQGSAATLFGLALVAVDRQDYAAARTLHAQRVRIEQEIGNRAGITHARGGLGLAALAEGDVVQARACFEAMLRSSRQAGDGWGEAWALTCYGQLAVAEGEYGQAHAYFAESLAGLRAAGGEFDVVWPLISLGQVAAAQGDWEQARAHYQATLRACQEFGSTRAVSAGLAGLARVARGEGQAARAAQLWGAAAGLWEVPGVWSEFVDRAHYARDAAEARAQLEDQAWAEGRAMTLEQAIAFALEQAPMPVEPASLASPTGEADRSSSTGPASSVAGPVSLTPRERAVLQLVAAGLTNKQIAAQLMISPFTVNMHLRAIYGKLAVTSRAAATRRAVERGLV